jgi:hypothetical protein
MTRQQSEEGPISTADIAEPSTETETTTDPAPTEETTDQEPVTLLDNADGEAFRQRWSDVQGRFVDDPRGAVRDADALVAELMRALAQGFAQHKSSLEEQWSSGGEDDTEQLRVALRRYRFFFSRLLAT